MFRIVPGNCPHGCGGTRLVITREETENAVEGYCEQCMKIFSGGYVSPEQSAGSEPMQPL
jgi:hypothetical protein